MKITAKQNASRRTKNRIKENDLDAECVLEKGPQKVQCLNNAKGVLVKSASDDWRGWLPVNEIEVNDD